MARSYPWRRKGHSAAAGGCRPGDARPPVVVEPAAGGFEVRVLAAGATVGHYLAALEEVPALTGWSAASCPTCCRCCRGRIPLTVLDLHPLARASGAGRGPRAPDAFLGRHGWVAVRGRAVDVTLRTGEDGYCVFLDRSRGLCRVYAARPVVCRTYFCVTVGPAARNLRAALVNAGMDELVRRWLAAALALRTPPVIHEAEEPSLRLADWPPGPFAGGRDPRQVPLRELVPPAPWRRLYRNDPGRA
ncbi:MAG: YkgJ family cysteine cluster protein [Firmicutes bacterium]|nr:YkgJ family cysteine cluster protein [Bacillota bacterium]